MSFQMLGLIQSVSTVFFHKKKSEDFLHCHHLHNCYKLSINFQLQNGGRSQRRHRRSLQWVKINTNVHMY